MNSRTNKNKEIRRRVHDEEKSLRKLKRQRRKKKILIGLLIVFILGIFYAHFIEPNMLLVHENKIISKTLESNFNGLKIVQFSDLHFGSTIHEKQLKRIVKKIIIISIKISN